MNKTMPYYSIACSTGTIQNVISARWQKGSTEIAEQILMHASFKNKPRASKITQDY
jgi:hypothetical protein